MSTVILRADPGGEVQEYAAPEHESQVMAPVQARDETDERLRVVTALAGEHLPAGAAEEFLVLLRPALRLVHAGTGEPVVAQLGGLPARAACWRLRRQLDPALIGVLAAILLAGYAIEVISENLVRWPECETRADHWGWPGWAWSPW